MASPRVLAVFQILASMLFLHLVFRYFYYTSPLQVPNMPNLIDRLAFTIRWQTFPAFTLIIGIGVVGSGRFSSSAMDPIHGRETDGFKVNKNYVQNTLEQFVLSAIGQLILTTYLSADQMHAIPIISLLFVVGRILFWLGYRYAYYARGFGFSLTWVPIVVVYLFNVTLFIQSGHLATLLGTVKVTGLP